MHLSNFEIPFNLSTDHIAKYVTKKLLSLWIPTFLSTTVHYNPPSALIRQESESASLSEKIHPKEGKQASYHNTPLMSRKCQPNSCHNKETSKSQQKN